MCTHCARRSWSSGWRPRTRRRGTPRPHALRCSRRRPPWRSPPLAPLQNSPSWTHPKRRPQLAGCVALYLFYIFGESARRHAHIGLSCLPMHERCTPDKVPPAPSSSCSSPAREHNHKSDVKRTARLSAEAKALGAKSCTIERHGLLLLHRLMFASLMFLTGLQGGGAAIGGGQGAGRRGGGRRGRRRRSLRTPVGAAGAGAGAAGRGRRRGRGGGRRTQAGAQRAADFDDDGCGSARPGPRKS